MGEWERMLKLVCVGAGEGWAGGIGTGETFGRDGEGAADTGRGGVGIAARVFWEVVAGTEPSVGCAKVGCGPVYTAPSSPGAKDRVEQKPSVEDMRSVRPSLDLENMLAGEKPRDVWTYHDKSENVAKCKLLTTHSGVVCCVSYTKTASCVATA